MLLKDHKATGLQRELLLWFEANKRHFPWRDTRDAYAILIAEKLLQQTAARPVVVAAYETVLQLYPDAARLAEADLEELHRIVAPLGLRYRAEELKALARHIVRRHGGAVPSTLEQLKALPGVGDYASRAVLSFAHGEDVPVVDTNVARFLYRLFGLRGPLPSNPARKKALLELAGTLVPPGRSRQFNLAVLDLCGLVCTPADPDCGQCPCSEHCCFGRCAAQVQTAAHAGKSQA